MATGLQKYGEWLNACRLLEAPLGFVSFYSCTELTVSVEFPFEILSLLNQHPSLTLLWVD